MNTSRRLSRSNTDRIVAGVAGGIANYLGVDPTLVRLGFVLLVLVAGVSPLIYIVLWAVLPTEQSADQPFLQQVQGNVVEIKDRATEVATKVSGQVNQFVGDRTKQNTPAQNLPHEQDGPATGPTRRL